MARWKKALLVATAVVGAMFLVLFGGGALMDPHISLDIEKRLSSPPAVVFGFLDNQAGLDAWWSTGQADAAPGSPKMRVKKKSGPDQGQGLAVEFVDDEGRVLEKWLVVAADAPRSIVYDVDFAGTMSVKRTLTLAADGDGTRVSWQERGTIQRPALRWMKVLMPPQTILDNFDRALAALDRAARMR